MVSAGVADGGSITAHQRHADTARSSSMRRGALGRLVDADRHVDRSGGRDRQQRDDLLDVLGPQHRDGVAPADAGDGQRCGDRQHLLPQLGVGQVAVRC